MMHANETITFHFRLPATKSSLLVFCAALFALTCFYLAYHPPKTGISTHLARHLSPSRVHGMFLALAVGTLAVTIAMVFLALRSQTSRRFLFLKPHSVALPRCNKAFSPFATVLYTDIRDVCLVTSQGHKILVVLTEEEEYHLPQKSFRSEEEFADFTRLLRDRAALPAKEAIAKDDLPQDQAANLTPPE